MTIYDKIRDEQLQYNIHRKAAKISAWSSSKIDKYKYLTGEKFLLFIQRPIIRKAKLTYCPLRKSFRKSNRKTRIYDKVSGHF